MPLKAWTLEFLGSKLRPIACAFVFARLTKRLVLERLVPGYISRLKVKLSIEKKSLFTFGDTVDMII